MLLLMHWVTLYTLYSDYRASSKYDQADFVLAGKGHGSNNFIEKVKTNSAVTVILARKDRIEWRDYNKTLYKKRNFVERLS